MGFMDDLQKGFAGLVGGDTDDAPSKKFAEAEAPEEPKHAEAEASSMEKTVASMVVEEPGAVAEADAPASSLFLTERSRRRVLEESEVHEVIRQSAAAEKFPTTVAAAVGELAAAVAGAQAGQEDRAEEVAAAAGVAGVEVPRREAVRARGGANGLHGRPVEEALARRK